MGSGGFILGGLLSGVGQGLAQDIQDRRAMALQQLRGQQAAESDARQVKAAEVAADKKYDRDKGLLALGSTLKIAEGNAATGNDIKKIGVKGQIDYKLQGQKIAGDRGLAELKGQIDTRLQAQKGVIDQGLEKLKSELDNGDVDSVQQTADGRYFIIKKDGSQTLTPYVGAPPGQKKGDDEDPIARRGAAKPAAAAATPAPKAAAKPAAAQPRQQSSSKPVLSVGEYQNAVNGAVRKRNAGEAGWKGLTDGELRTKLADIYSAAGYGLPDIK